MKKSPTAPPAAPPIAPQKRGRGPSIAKTAATRAALIDAALAEFVEKGFAAATMSHIAERAGLAKGTTYLHFKSKEVLFAEMLRGIIGETAIRPIGRPRLDESTRDFLMRTVPPRLRELQQNGSFRVIPLVVAEGQRMPEIAEIYRNVAIDPVMRFVDIHVRRARRRRELPAAAPAVNPVLLAAPVVTGVLWNALFSRQDAEVIDIGALFSQFLALLFPAA